MYLCHEDIIPVMHAQERASEREKEKMSFADIEITFVGFLLQMKKTVVIIFLLIASNLDH